MGRLSAITRIGAVGVIIMLLLAAAPLSAKPITSCDPEDPRPECQGGGGSVLPDSGSRGSGSSGDEQNSHGDAEPEYRPGPDEASPGASGPNPLARYSALPDYVTEHEIDAVYLAATAKPLTLDPTRAQPLDDVRVVNQCGHTPDANVKLWWHDGRLLLEAQTNGQGCIVPAGYGLDSPLLAVPPVMIRLPDAAPGHYAVHGSVWRETGSDVAGDTLLGEVTVTPTLYPDRAIAPLGEDLFVHGCRWPPGTTVLVQWADAHDRSPLTQGDAAAFDGDFPVEIGEDGCFSKSFTVPEGAAPGVGRLEAVVSDERKFGATVNRAEADLVLGDSPVRFEPYSNVVTRANHVRYEGCGWDVTPEAVGSSVHVRFIAPDNTEQLVGTHVVQDSGCWQGRFLLRADAWTGNYVLEARLEDSDATFGRHWFERRAITVTDALPTAVIGDSYSSGEGTLLYDLDDPTAQCHRSSRSWGEQVTDMIGNRDARNFACTGAQIVRGFLNPYANVGITARRPQVDELVENGPYEYLFLTIGGNDAGFGPAVETCVSPLEASPCQDGLRMEPVKAWPQNGFLGRPEGTLAVFVEPAALDALNAGSHLQCLVRPDEIMLLKNTGAGLDVFLGATGRLDFLDAAGVEAADTVATQCLTYGPLDDDAVVRAVGSFTYESWGVNLLAGLPFLLAAPLQELADRLHENRTAIGIADPAEVIIGEYPIPFLDSDFNVCTPAPNALMTKEEAEWAVETFIPALTATMHGWAVANGFSYARGSTLGMAGRGICDGVPVEAEKRNHQAVWGVRPETLQESYHPRHEGHMILANCAAGKLPMTARPTALSWDRHAGGSVECPGDIRFNTELGMTQAQVDEMMENAYRARKRTADEFHCVFPMLLPPGVRHPEASRPDSFAPTFHGCDGVWSAPGASDDPGERAAPSAMGDVILPDALRPAATAWREKVLTRPVFDADVVRSTESSAKAFKHARQTESAILFTASDETALLALSGHAAATGAAVILVDVASGVPLDALADVLPVGATVTLAGRAASLVGARASLEDAGYRVREEHLGAGDAKRALWSVNAAEDAFPAARAVIVARLDGNGNPTDVAVSAAPLAATLGAPVVLVGAGNEGVNALRTYLADLPDLRRVVIAGSGTGSDAPLRAGVAAVAGEAVLSVLDANALLREARGALCACDVDAPVMLLGKAVRDAPSVPPVLVTHASGGSASPGTGTSAGSPGSSGSIAMTDRLRILTGAPYGWQFVDVGDTFDEEDLPAVARTPTRVDPGAAGRGFHAFSDAVIAARHHAPMQAAEVSVPLGGVALVTPALRHAVDDWYKAPLQDAFRASLSPVPPPTFTTIRTDPCPGAGDCVKAEPAPECPAGESLVDDACVDLATSMQHCGKAQNPVPDVPRAKEGCRGGAFVILGCERGWLNEDAEFVNGCEARENPCSEGETRVDDACVDFATSMQHCGKAHNPVPNVARAKEKCENGAFAIAKCDKNWMDADGRFATGCERQRLDGKSCAGRGKGGTYWNGRCYSR